MRSTALTIFASLALTTTFASAEEMTGVGRNSAIDANGVLQVFGHVENFNSFASVREGSSPTTWSSWHYHNGVRFRSLPVPGKNLDGRLEVFGVAEDGRLLHTWQVRHGQTGQNTWLLGWQPLPGNYVGEPAVSRDRDGKLHAFVRGADGALWMTRQAEPNGGWYWPWSLGGSLASPPAVGIDAFGYQHVFAVGTDNKLWSMHEVLDGVWSAWTSHGGVVSGTPAAARNSDGNLHVFVRGADNQIWHMRQSQLMYWGAWAQLPGSFVGSPAVAANQDGRLEVVAIGSNQATYHSWQHAPSGTTFAPFTTFGGTTRSRLPDIVRRTNGRLSVFVIGVGDRTLYHVDQVAPNSGWGGWNSTVSPPLLPN